MAVKKRTRQMILPGMTEKRCPSCKTVKPFSEYSKCARTKNGITVYCKPCTALLNRSPKTRLAQAKVNAKYRKLEWSISVEDYMSLLENPCVYCSGPLPPTGAGLDRINDDIGYTKDNCVPACAICNFMKCRTFTFEEMKVIGRAVAEVRKMRGLGPTDHIFMHLQKLTKRRPYRSRRKGGDFENGWRTRLPPQDRVLEN